jgi:hypothetical protein
LFQKFEVILFTPPLGITRSFQWGRAPAAYIVVVPRLIQRLGGADPTAGREAGRGRELGRWREQAGRATFGPPCIGSCLGLARRAEVAAQTLKGCRAGPALGTMDRASGRARVVLFRAVPRTANRARPIWKSIPRPESSYGPARPRRKATQTTVLHNS